MKVPNELANPALSSIRIGVWNVNVPPYNFKEGVYSENLISKFTLSAGSIEDIIFDTPLLNVEDGSCLTVVVETTGIITGIFQAQQNPKNVIISTLGTSLIDFDGTGATQRNFRAQGVADARCLPLATLTDPPNVVAFGDSLASGYAQNISFVDVNILWFVDVGITWIKKVSDNYGWTYQNNSNGGETIAQSFGRFERDVINKLPKAVFILFGGADYLASSTADLMISGIKDILDECVSNNIIPIVLGSAPFTELADAKHTIRRDYNLQLEGFTSSHNAIIINLDSTLGVIRTSTGELDDLNPTYKHDNQGHWNEAGNTAVANKIIEIMDAQ